MVTERNVDTLAARYLLDSLTCTCIVVHSTYVHANVHIPCTQMELNLITQGDDSKFPVLSAFLSQEKQLRALRYLPQVIEWQNLLLTRYTTRPCGGVYTGARCDE